MENKLTLIIMLKNNKTGILENEIAKIDINDFENNIHNIYAFENKNGTKEIFIRLTCNKKNSEIEDWEFEAIFDYYNLENIKPFVNSIEEDDNFFNPCWNIILNFYDENYKNEEIINKILSIHKSEIDSIYQIISNKKGDYIDD